MMAFLLILYFLAQLIHADNPCATISDLYQNSTAGYYQLRIPAKLALDCLNDVPFHSEAAVEWLNSIKPYIKWQSTTAYLKDPPPTYLMPAVDIWGQLDELEKRARSESGFANEYELGFAIYKLFQSTHDGHFRYVPSILQDFFAFGRPISLISYSIDGVQLPKIYVYNDVLSYYINDTISKFSAVEIIDGRKASDFIEEWAMKGALQDPDALYNTVFYSLASASLGYYGNGPGTFAGAGRGALEYPGDNTTITFENGTTRVFENFARVIGSFTSIQNGTDIYQRINSQASASTSAGKTDPQKFASLSAPAGYPNPVEQEYGNPIAGYYLEQPGYEDVAVLAVASFSLSTNYQDVAYNFLEKAKNAGKNKLIIDLSANGGGNIFNGYSLFLNLFPGILPYGATRLRSHEVMDVMGETVSERVWRYPANASDGPYSYLWGDWSGTPFNYRADVNENYKDFQSWRQKNPPNQFAGDNFTALIRWNFSDPEIGSTSNFVLNGFGSRKGMPPSRPFEPEDIVLLFDGYCASTCFLFTEAMTQQVGNVKTVSIGGRPNNKPMQTVGGVKGANNWSWDVTGRLVTATYNLAPDLRGYLNTSGLATYLDRLPLIRGSWSDTSINIRDAIRIGDESQTPLQFVYDEADCRLYYTVEMTIDVATMWEKVADVAWDGDKCAVGGFRHDFQPPLQLPPRSTRRSQKQSIRRHKTMSASQILAIEKTLDILENRLTAQPGLMLP